MLFLVVSTEQMLEQRMRIMVFKITSDASFLRILFDLFFSLLQVGVQDGCQYNINLLISRITMSDIKVIYFCCCPFFSKLIIIKLFIILDLNLIWVADNHKHYKSNMEGHRYNNQMIQPIQSMKRKPENEIHTT